MPPYRLLLAFLGLLAVIGFASGRSASSSVDLTSRVSALESRVAELERKISGGATASGSGGLKVQDMKGGTAQPGGQLPGLPSGAGFSPEQRKELDRQLELFKKQRQEQQKALDELDKEL